MVLLSCFRIVVLVYRTLKLINLLKTLAGPVNYFTQVCLYSRVWDRSIHGFRMSPSIGFVHLRFIQSHAMFTFRFRTVAHLPSTSRRRMHELWVTDLCSTLFAYRFVMFLVMLVSTSLYLKQALLGLRNISKWSKYFKCDAHVPMVCSKWDDLTQKYP